MATFKDAAAFAREVRKLERDIDGREAQSIALEQARQAQKIARRAASADLGGDPKFSGWAPRLATVVKPIRPNGAILKPTRTSAGPWTVAEFGRNTNTGFANVRRTRSGGVKVLKSGRVSVRRRKRWNGVTAGKGTASDAEAQMERDLPRIVKKRFDVIVGKHFD